MSPSQLIDSKIQELGDWRGETLARIRVLIKEGDPDVVEEVKWRKLRLAAFLLILVAIYRKNRSARS